MSKRARRSNLGLFTFKEIDKFLWSSGEKTSVIDIASQIKPKDEPKIEDWRRGTRP